MIKFGSNNKVDNIGILTEEEVGAYVDFLEAERNRHLSSITECWRQLDLIAVYPKNKEYDKAFTALWRSAVMRHRKDIEDIDRLIETVKGFYGI